MSQVTNNDAYSTYVSVFLDCFWQDIFESFRLVRSKMIMNAGCGCDKTGKTSYALRSPGGTPVLPRSLWLPPCTHYFHSWVRYSATILSGTNVLSFSSFRLLLESIYARTAVGPTQETLFKWQTYNLSQGLHIFMECVAQWLRRN